MKYAGLLQGGGGYIYLMIKAFINNPIGYIWSSHQRRSRYTKVFKTAFTSQ